MLMSLDVTTSKTYTTIPELASEWRGSIAHVHNLIARKQLPAYRVGFRYIVRCEDAKRFLESNATVSAAA